jgi:hypothetical protein
MDPSEHSNIFALGRMSATVEHLEQTVSAHGIEILRITSLLSDVRSDMREMKSDLTEIKSKPPPASPPPIKRLDLAQTIKDWHPYIWGTLLAWGVASGKINAHEAWQQFSGAFIK